MIYKPARYHPNVIFLVAGRLAIQIAVREMAYPIKSIIMWDASVKIASEFEKYPPEKEGQLKPCIFVIIDMYNTIALKVIC